MELNNNPCQEPNQPRIALAMVANQRAWQRTQNEAFYAMLPPTYLSFYNNYVRQWLYWYDGFVPNIHGTQYGILSSSIGTTIVNRAADQVFGGDLMFKNARKPRIYTDVDGKRIGKALDFISNEWTESTGAKSVIKRAIKNAMAGGFSLIKLNNGESGLYPEDLRADRFYVAHSPSGIRRVVCVLSVYNSNIHGDSDRYVLIEERRYEDIGVIEENEIPVVEYRMYRTSAPVQFLSTGWDGACVKWNDLPKEVRKAFKEEYGTCRLNEPVALNGFTDLGVYLLRASDGVSALPQIGLGESILANVLTYLYEYDYANTALNTDMYMARGRVMIPKPLQSPRSKEMNGSYPAGLDGFEFTKYPTQDGDDGKPIPIQFELRSEEWKSVRNTFLENIATGIGLSVSTLASYLNDASNRTAREVSAEETATALFVESMRGRFDKPLNDMIAAVLRYNGYVDDVEIRWSRAGMTNQTVMVDTLSRAVQAGLISRKKAHHQFNYDDDEEQNEEDYAIVLEEEKAAQDAQNRSMWDVGDSIGG